MTMMRFYVDIYTYDSSAATTYLISGYNYEDTKWYQLSATAIGNNTNKSSLTVRFGYENSQHCLWIGEVTTQWSYVQVQIRDLLVGYAGYDDGKFKSGWTISFVSSFGTITNSISNPHILSSSISGNAATATYATRSGSTISTSQPSGAQTWYNTGTRV